MVFVKKITHAMTWLAALCLIILMLLTFVDVVGRQFNRPLTYSVELTELVMGLLIMLGLATVTLKRGHISVDVLSAAAPLPVRSFLQRIAAAVGFVFIALIAWRLWEKGFDFFGDGLKTSVLFLPVYPVVFAMALAAAWAAFIIAAQVFNKNVEDQD